MTTATESPRLLQAIMDSLKAPEQPSLLASPAGNLFAFHTAMQMREGFAGERPVIWTNVFFPYELCYALDLSPLSFEVMGALTGVFGMHDALDLADDTYSARDTCTFLRAGLGGGLSGLFPLPAALVCSSHLCEGAPKVAHALSRERGVPYLLLDVPDRHTPEAEAYLALQLEDMAGELARITGRRLDRDALAETCDTSNRAAAALHRYQTLRQRSPAPAFGSAMMGIRLNLPWGHETGVQIAELLEQAAQAHVDAGTSPLPGGEAFRLLWFHLRPYYETDLFNFLEIERRAVIVYSNLGAAFWEPLDPSDPFRSLARRTLQNPDLGTAQEAAAYYRRVAREHRVDGVVQFSHWGCRWNAGRYRILKDAFAEDDIPFINVDGDGCDARAATAGQLRTRLEGFIEILEARDT